MQLGTVPQARLLRTVSQATGLDTVPRITQLGTMLQATRLGTVSRPNKLDTLSQTTKLGTMPHAKKLNAMPLAMGLGTVSDISQLDMLSYKDKIRAAAGIITSLRDAPKNATSQASLVQVKTEKQRLKSGTIVHSKIFVLKLHGCPTSYSKLHFCKSRIS